MALFSKMTPPKPPPAVSGEDHRERDEAKEHLDRSLSRADAVIAYAMRDADRVFIAPYRGHDRRQTR